MSVPFFLIPFIVGLATQGMKPFLNKQFYAQLEEAGRRVPRYGGMPSAHTSFAVSLVTVIGYVDGIGSTTFTLAAALLLLILDDALRMRMFLGRYGRALYQLVEKLPEEEKKQFPYVERRLGHKPLEVLVGAVVGLFLTGLILYFLALVG